MRRYIYGPFGNFKTGKIPNFKISYIFTADYAPSLLALCLNIHINEIHPFPYRPIGIGNYYQNDKYQSKTGADLKPWITCQSYNHFRTEY